MMTAIRKLMLVVMISVFAQAAVGLGNLTTNSRLGEALDLGLELLSIPGGGTDSIKSGYAVAVKIYRSWSTP